MLSAIHVLGDYWRDDVDEVSGLGALVSEAKNFGSPSALRELQAEMAGFARTVAVAPDCVVVAVPPAPGRNAHPVPALAEAVGQSLGRPVLELVARRNVTPRLRDTPPADRRGVVEAAGYEANSQIHGQSVLLVDDVILTGTTLTYLAELLIAAGAAQVDAVVACRTRRR